MNDIQPDTAHLSKLNNPEVEEFLATKSAGDTVELRVTAQIREINETGAVLDIIAAEAEESMPELPATDPATAETISAVMSGDY